MTGIVNLNFDKIVVLITKGIGEGLKLSPFFQNIAAGIAYEHVRISFQVEQPSRTLKVYPTEFADDLTFVTQSKPKVKEAIVDLIERTEPMGLLINCPKCS